MPGNVQGLLYTLLLIVLCEGFSIAIRKAGTPSEIRSEISRKVLHIGVSNFALIYLYIFTSDIIPVIGLASFAVINIFTSEKRLSGLVIYPLSVILMIAIKNLGFGSKVAVACGLLGMGWGDGLAAITGILFGKKKFFLSKTKTWVGFFTMFVVVFMVVLLITGSHDSASGFASVLLISLVSSIAEVYTPYGLDNLTVPLVLFFMTGALC